MPFSFQVLISSFYVTVNRRLRILRQTIESQGFFRAIFLYFDLRSYYIIIRHSMSWVFSFLTQISFLKWWWFPRLWLRHMSVTTSSTSKTCSLRGRWGKSMLVHKKSTVYKTQSQFLLGWPASLRHLRRLTDEIKLQFLIWGELRGCSRAARMQNHGNSEQIQNKAKDALCHPMVYSSSLILF